MKLSRVSFVALGVVLLFSAGGCGSDGATPDSADSGPHSDASATDGSFVNLCVAADGQCVPVIPNACASGTLADSTRYPCAPPGTVGVECCLAAQDGGSSDADASVDCATAGGSCVGIGQCAAGVGHLGAGQYACGAGPETVCCFPQGACGGTETFACCTSTTVFRPVCSDGALLCESPETQCMASASEAGSD